MTSQTGEPQDRPDRYRQSGRLGAGHISDSTIGEGATIAGEIHYHYTERDPEEAAMPPEPPPGSDRFRQSISAIARICHPNGTVLGAGFVAARNCVITCAHVVSSALPQTDSAGLPRGTVQLQFPLSNNRSDTFTARVVFWRPSRCGRVTEASEGEDLAALVVEETLPEDIFPMPLQENGDYWGHHCRIFGFPKEKKAGTWRETTLQTIQGQGWVQMTAANRPVEKGFSGSPVWDADFDGVMGITVAAEPRRERDAFSYAIPARYFTEALPLGELAYLLRTVEDIEQLRRAYDAACPDGWQTPAPSSVVEMVADLNDVPPLKDAPTALAKFVAHLALDPAAARITEELEEWGGAWDERFEDFYRHLRSECQQQEHDEAQASQDRVLASYVMIIIRRDRLSAWFVPDERLYSADKAYGCEYFEVEYKKDKSKLFQKICLALKELRKQIVVPENCDCLTYEFFLGDKNLIEPIDRLEINRIPIGNDFRVVLRSLKRIKNYEFRNCWVQQWRELERQNLNILNVNHNSWQQLYTDINRERSRSGRAIVLKIERSPTPEFFDPATHNNGTVAAIWSRCSSSRINCSQELTELLGGAMVDLPERVRRKRAESLPESESEHIGHHISLIFENPNRIPPDIDYAIPQTQ